MKRLTITLFFILVAGNSGFASAKSGVADRYNEARSYPSADIKSDSAKTLCQQHRRLHEQMSKADPEQLDQHMRQMKGGKG
ncbi:hypothetical protein EB809_08160 [Marinobacter sp. R17]|uniref:hypothetical protein n=1 Tax=Marinobacter sp. R17 TaxID=2484250 RepID=UPI000F4CE96B|nr:hypothetical protein [Marinobacter sp. R17]ROU00460.1 hypothetical protein EB809_08160 [Marinobacter sp. R17]